MYDTFCCYEIDWKAIAFIRNHHVENFWLTKDQISA